MEVTSCQFQASALTDLAACAFVLLAANCHIKRSGCRAGAWGHVEGGRPWGMETTKGEKMRPSQPLAISVPATRVPDMWGRPCWMFWPQPSSQLTAAAWVTPANTMWSRRTAQSTHRIARNNDSLFQAIQAITFWGGLWNSNRSTPGLNAWSYPAVPADTFLCQFSVSSSRKTRAGSGDSRTALALES